jgi:polysaccharide export outer membrane protein
VTIDGDPNTMQIKTIICVLAIIFFVNGLALAQSEEYVIGKEDVLEISFWQDPDLNQIVKVRQDGKITLSIIGEITAAGLTTNELADRIVRNVSLYNKQISQATVTVRQFNSRKVFVSGQVAVPGKYTFEVIPDIWTVIKEAGGTTPVGDLTRVAIIRSEERGGEIVTVNVLEAIAEGKLEDLPKLESGDTIEIPRMAGGVPGRQLAVDYTERKNLYYIVGQIAQPGVRPYEGETDLLDAIGNAGGPTELADLEDVRVVSKTSEGTSVLHVDYERYQESGQAHRIKIKPEDTIVIGRRTRGFGFSQIRDFVAIAGTIVSFALLADRL